MKYWFRSCCCAAKITTNANTWKFPFRMRMCWNGVPIPYRMPAETDRKFR